MIELIEVGDRKSGRRFQSDAAPIRLGRRPGLDIVLPDAGVFDLHAEIGMDAEGWYTLRPAGPAIVSVNDRPVQQHRLRNGDVMGLGSTKFQFSIRTAPQKSMRRYEYAVWTLIAAMLVGALTALLGIGR